MMTDEEKERMAIIEQYSTRCVALEKENASLRAALAKAESERDEAVIEALDLVESEDESAQRINEMIEYIETLRSANNSLTRELAASKAREIKVRWEGDEAFIGTLKIGAIRCDEVNRSWGVFCDIAQCVCCENTETDARAAVEQAAIDALSGGE